MNAFVPAGKVPQPPDPLAPLSRGRPKALIPVAGKPMIQWVVGALAAVPAVERIAVIGLPPQPDLTCAKPLDYVPDQGDILLNALAGLAWARRVAPDTPYALIASSDIPAITPEIVQWRIEAGMAAAPFDLDYAVVERAVMERRFPGANRSFVRLRGAEVCGGDLNLVRVDMTVRRDLWSRLLGRRKSARSQAALIGLDTLLLLLLRRLTLEAAVDRIGRRLGVVGHAQLSPFAEVAMDVDKPEQLEIVARDLIARSGSRS